MKRQKEFITVFIVIALFAFVAVARWLKIKNVPVEKLPIASAKTLGSPEAPIEIVEYSDFQCSACAKGSRVLHKYLKSFPDKIFLEFRYFPIEEIHPHAIRAAVYAECAARQGLFWPLQDLLFTGQAQWSKEGVDTEWYFNEYARSLKADMDQLNACLEDDTAESVIVRDRAEARFRGVSATPTFFVNGKIAVGSTALQEELKRYLSLDSGEETSP